MTLQKSSAPGILGPRALERRAWTEGLDLPVLEPGKPVEYLYWVGCSASYDRRNQAIARSVVKILKRAGVSFGVMAEERCHGEVARRLGNEYLYQMVTEENVGNIKHYAFEKVITHCPHCFNTIKNGTRVDGTSRFSPSWSPRAAPLGPHHAHHSAGQTLPPTPAIWAATNGIFDAPRETAIYVPASSSSMPRTASEALLRVWGGRCVETPARKRVNVPVEMRCRSRTWCHSCPFFRLVYWGGRWRGRGGCSEGIAERVAESLE